MQHYAWRIFITVLNMSAVAFNFSSLRKNSSALHSLLKRVVSTFSKDTGELASASLDFMRQILNADAMVSVHLLFLFDFFKALWITSIKNISWNLE